MYAGQDGVRIYNQFEQGTSISLSNIYEIFFLRDIMYSKHTKAKDARQDEQEGAPAAYYTRSILAWSALA